jgi:hypothetical protein
LFGSPSYLTGRRSTLRRRRDRSEQQLLAHHGALAWEQTNSSAIMSGGLFKRTTGRAGDFCEREITLRFRGLAFDYYALR